MTTAKDLAANYKFGRATLIQGNYGSGREELARAAIKHMGLEVYFFNLDCCEPSDVEEGIKTFSQSTKPMGAVFSGLDKVRYDWQAMFAVMILPLVRFDNRAAFLTTLPGGYAQVNVVPNLIGTVVDIDYGVITKVIELP